MERGSSSKGLPQAFTLLNPPKRRLRHKGDNLEFNRVAQTRDFRTGERGCPLPIPLWQSTKRCYLCCRIRRSPMSAGAHNHSINPLNRLTEIRILLDQFVAGSADEDNHLNHDQNPAKERITN